MVTTQERIVAKIRVDQKSGCWVWTGALWPTGYGQIRIGPKPGKLRKAHRVSYEMFRGPVPEGLELDHLCRVLACVNPWHLEAVTHGENMRRGDGWGGKHARATHCPKGHPYDEANTYVNPRGSRECRKCRAAYMRTYSLRKRAGTG